MPTRIRPSAPLVPAVTMLLALGAAAPTAEAMPPEVHRALQRLRTYDGQPVRALEELRSLEANRSAPSADRREAAFLRTAVSADLWLLAELDGRAPLRAALAAHWGADPEALHATLAGRLQRISFGVYAEPAQDALAALRHVTEGRPFSEPPRGDRTGLLYVRAVVDAAGRPDALAALAALAPDPCPELGPGCPEPEARFGARGRRAAAALRAAGRHLERALRAAEEGDPLAASLLPRLRTWREALRKVSLAPRVRLPADWGVADSGDEPSWEAPDLLLVVEAERVRLSTPPRLAFDGREPVAAAGPLPALPRHEAVALPASFRPAVRPVEPVVAALAAAREGGATTLAFAAAPGTPAHVLARVLRSATAAGLRPVAVLGRDADGLATVVPVSVVHRQRLASAEARRALLVRVRLGGFTLRAGQRSRDLPRVRDERGLRFDFAALVLEAGRTPGHRQALVDYMTAAPSEAVLGALTRLAGPQRPVALLLP